MEVPRGTTPRQVIKMLRDDPWNERYSYDEFVNVLKTRLYRYTGKEEAMFYSEEQIVAELERLEEISYVDE